MADEARWPALDVTPNLCLRITGRMPALPGEIDARVDRLWEAAQQDRKLFNGTIFCADRIGPTQIEGHWTEYRRLIAQVGDPALWPALRVRSLAVCGVLHCRDGVVAGRREAGAIYQPGEWQLPPAGSVDFNATEPGGASWRTALLAELQEELGIGSADVRDLRPLCLVQHPSGVLDLGIEIATALTGEDVLETHRRSGNREYDRLLVAPPAAIPMRVAAEGGCLTPSSVAFLARTRSGVPRLTSDRPDPHQAGSGITPGEAA